MRTIFQTILCLLFLIKTSFAMDELTIEGMEYEVWIQPTPKNQQPLHETTKTAPQGHDFSQLQQFPKTNKELPKQTESYYDLGNGMFLIKRKQPILRSSANP